MVSQTPITRAVSMINALRNGTRGVHLQYSDDGAGPTTQKGGQHCVNERQVLLILPLGRVKALAVSEPEVLHRRDAYDVIEPVSYC